MSNIDQPMGSEDPNLLLQSKAFYEGYGDFALQSSDGVIFHISRFLLAYASPVFEDMFNLAAGNGHRMSISSMSMADEVDTHQIHASSNAMGSEGILVAKEHKSQAVILTENATTLDLLFRHIDPKQTPHPLRENTIRQLLEAARKYQLSSVSTWFENEVMKHTEYPYSDHPNTAATTPNNHHYGPLSISERSLMSRDPLLVLALASEYDLPRLMQQAVLQLVESPISILEKDVDVGFKLHRHIHILRQSRIQFYMNCIKDAAALKESGKPAQPSVCSTCSYPRSSWIMEITQAVLNTPTWEIFTDAVNNPTRNCQWGCGTWSKQLSISMNKWRPQAMGFETLSPLPK
jgi:hypothetical protein